MRKLKLRIPKVEYKIAELAPSEFHVLRILIYPTIKQRVTTKLAVCSTLEEAQKWLNDYFAKIDKEMEEEDLNEIKESYIGLEGDR